MPNSRVHRLTSNNITHIKKNVSHHSMLTAISVRRDPYTCFPETGFLQHHAISFP